MILRLLSITAIAVLSCCTAVGQTPSTSTNATPPRRTGPPPVRSAEIDKDNKVTFRIRAPKAGEVSLNGQWPEGKVPLARVPGDTNGTWSVTVGPVPEGIWEYSFQVDGLVMIDPANPWIKPMREPRSSILQIVGQPPLLHDFRDVPHGVVHQHAYHSTALNKLRELVVYTPPEYDSRREARYPVLFLQHGSGDNQATWVTHGKAHWIIDNLIADKQAVPMVVVMMDGHAVAPGEPGAPTGNTQQFERDLLMDVMPFVEANYHVRTDALGRGIVGLSMGGGQSLTIGLNHRELFAWVGGFSSGTPKREEVAVAFDHPQDTNAKLKLLWIGCGQKDFLLKRNEDFVGELKKAGIEHQWELTEGDHSWPVWRKYLGLFVPKLFQGTKPM